jgi:hypothetical protein
VDPGTFEQLSPAFSRDSRRVFYLDREIAVADQPAFEPLEGMSARDANSVTHGALMRL